MERNQVNQGAITWSQFRNALPLLGALVAVVLSYAVLKSDVLLNKQQQDTTDSNVVEMKKNIDDINRRTQTMAEDIAAIKATLGIRASNQAGASAVLSPKPATQDLPNSAPHLSQSQTVIAEARPTPVPTLTPEPTPTAAPAPIIPPIIPISPIITIPILGIAWKLRGGEK